jgi:hypothetical protein
MLKRGYIKYGVLGTMLSRLSEKVYPEYSTIFDLMLERTEHPW